MIYSHRSLIGSSRLISKSSMTLIRGELTSCPSCCLRMQVNRLITKSL
nr:MAG TPA: hypothetical protein [Caudoviricetes sp.]